MDGERDLHRRISQTSHLLTDEINVQPNRIQQAHIYIATTLSELNSFQLGNIVVVVLSKMKKTYPAKSETRVEGVLGYVETNFFNINYLSVSAQLNPG